MGAGLVKAAFDLALRLHLDHAPTRLLVYMALSAVDSDARPVFWAGRDALAEALGKTGSAGHKAVTRALQTLSASSAIESTASAPGRNARHFLQDGNGHPLRPAIEGRSPSLVPTTGDADRPVNGGRSADERRTVSGRTEDGQRPPEEEQEEKEEGMPSRFCSNHPNGTRTPCGACGDARRASEAWRAPRKQPPAHVHSYDALSGWCACGTREETAA